MSRLYCGGPKYAMNASNTNIYDTDDELLAQRRQRLNHLNNLNNLNHTTAEALMWQRPTSTLARSDAQKPHTTPFSVHRGIHGVRSPATLGVMRGEQGFVPFGGGEYAAYLAAHGGAVDVGDEEAHALELGAGGLDWASSAQYRQTFAYPMPNFAVNVNPNTNHAAGAAEPQGFLSVPKLEIEHDDASMYSASDMDMGMDDDGSSTGFTCGCGCQGDQSDHASANAPSNRSPSPSPASSSSRARRVNRTPSPSPAWAKNKPLPRTPGRRARTLTPHHMPAPFTPSGSPSRRAPPPPAPVVQATTAESHPFLHQESKFSGMGYDVNQFLMIGARQAKPASELKPTWRAL